MLSLKLSLTAKGKARAPQLLQWFIFVNQIEFIYWFVDQVVDRLDNN
jgi:hypothetical protein